MFMAASQMMKHDAMYRLAVESDVGGGYLDRICSCDLSKPGLWQFLGIKDDTRAISFWACAFRVICLKQVEGIGYIYELLLCFVTLLLLSLCKCKLIPAHTTHIGGKK